MNGLNTFYSKEQNCFDDICKGREMLGLRSTTREQFANITKTLAAILLYAPTERAQIAAEAALIDATRREFFFICNVWPEQERKQGGIL